MVWVLSSLAALEPTSIHPPLFIITHSWELQLPLDPSMSYCLPGLNKQKKRHFFYVFPGTNNTKYF